MRMKAELELNEVDGMLAAAEQEALRNGWAVSIAIVDDGGYLLAFRRLAGASKSSTQIAIDKARSAAITRRPTRFFEEMLASGRTGAASLAGVIPMVGGLPALFDGQVVGAIAVSGVKGQFDEQIAEAGLAFLNRCEGR
ncbi:MAG: heme-binding protein [Achromobacter sp.]|nr:heme-binding protein [Achromobacter sp.]